MFFNLSYVIYNNTLDSQNKFKFKIATKTGRLQGNTVENRLNPSPSGNSLQIKTVTCLKSGSILN